MLTNWCVFIETSIFWVGILVTALKEESNFNYYCKIGKIEQFFLTVGPNKFGIKILLDFTSLLSICQSWVENPKEKSQNFSKIGAHSKNCWRTSKTCWTNSCESDIVILSVTSRKFWLQWWRICLLWWVDSYWCK